MRSLHLVILDVLLPKQLAEYASKDLSLPALEKLLARAAVQPLAVDTLEDWLAGQFGVTEHALAALSLQADGMEARSSYWLRADPVSVEMQRERMVLRTDISLAAEEAERLCQSLNRHFDADGLRFHAPHPLRWYVSVPDVPLLQTRHLSQVLGADMHANLPQGRDALHWHGVLNEIQMLLYTHEVNQAREQRGEAMVSGVWLWGGGFYPESIQRPFAGIYTDSDLARAFAHAAGSQVLQQLNWGSLQDGETLLICFESLRNALHRADLQHWRSEMQRLEQTVFGPALQALSSGQIGLIKLDALIEGGSRRFVIKRADLLKFWRFSRKLQHYALAAPGA